MNKSRIEGSNIMGLRINTGRRHWKAATALTLLLGGGALFVARHYPSDGRTETPLAERRIAHTPTAAEPKTLGVETMTPKSAARPSQIPSSRSTVVLPPLPGPLATRGAESAKDVLLRLSGEARLGSSKAAYDAFVVADFCAQRKKFETLLASVGRDVQEGSVVHDAASASLSRIAEVCGDISPALLDERFEHIRMAAEKGYKGASEGYLMAGPRGIPLELVSELRKEPSVAAWRDSALMYFARDAEAGDINAMGRLAEIYSDGKFWPSNPMLALAYHLAAVEAVQRSDRPYNEGQLAMQKQRASSVSLGLSAADRKAAQSFAEELIKRCCGQPKGVS